MRTSMLPALPETGICGRRCVVRRSRSPRWHDLGCRAQALTEAAVWRNVCVDVAPMPVPRGVEYGCLPFTPEACVDGILAMPQACEASPARPTAPWSGNPVRGGGNGQDFKRRCVEVRAPDDAILEGGSNGGSQN